MHRLRSLYHKFVEQIRETSRIPHYNYDKVLRQIQYASYPASLGSINLILYQYVKTVKTQTIGSPEIFFLIASVLFFFISIIIGLGVGIAQEEPVLNRQEMQELKYRQAFAIIFAFGLAIVFDLLGLLFLVAMHMAS